MPYTILLRPAAERDYRRLPATIQSRVRPLLLALADDPRPPGTVKLTGQINRWRLRTGDYRLIYSVDDHAHEVTILRILHRREAYR